jgi:GTPase SAR1 family protein
MFAQIVMGPAGSGKSTYCAAMQTHAQMMNRTIHIMNADPAAEGLKYEPSLDIRNLISIDDVKEELGPNGGLVYCIEHLTNNLDWLTEQLGEEYTEDYLLIDMPGQWSCTPTTSTSTFLRSACKVRRKKRKKKKKKNSRLFKVSATLCAVST